MVLSSSSQFHALSLRPPTPPREAHDADQDAQAVLDFLDDPFGMKQPAPKLSGANVLLNTPQSSPSSHAPDPPSSVRSSARKKRVNFEATADGNAAHLQTFVPLYSSPLRPLPQTRLTRPLKSILKPSDGPSPPPPTDQGTTPRHFESFAEMLESIMKQLASQTRSSRFDAYHALQQAMQRYEKMPNTESLIDKMGLLTQFIQRDMHAIGINGTSLDSQLIGQALKFLMALLRIPDARNAMPDEFCTYVVDRIIQVAADASLPKVVINTHLAVLMQQNFRPRTMTLARIERILDGLDTIEDRVSGLSVQAYRVRIYRKLIMQRPEVMSKHTERWIKHTLSALLSTLKDINQSALDTTISAAKAFGNDRQVTKTVLAVVNKVKSDGETVTHGMVKQLERLLASDHAAMVPQVWAAVTALLPGCLDKNQFPAFAEWLTVFQMCFNSSKEDVKMHANIALGFLAYSVQLKEKTTSAWSKMLIRIPQAQFEGQRSQSKKSDREAATSAYFALLYHALGPAASHKQLDRYWSDFVVDFWKPLVRPSPEASSSSPKHAIAACRVLSALLNGTRKVCDPLRTLDLRPQALLQRDDLPSLDPQWVRKSVASILEFIEVLLDVTPWTCDDCKDKPSKTMWLALLSSLNNASSQEVMVSNDSKDAMAHLVNFLRRVWDTHTAQLALSQQKEDNWADKFCFLLESVVGQLGATRFSNKCIVRNADDEFEVAATPSHRSRSHITRTSPLLYFMDLLVNQSEGKLADSLRLRAINVLIKPCFDAQSIRLGRLELLRDCALLVDASARTPLSDIFWSEIANLTTASIVEQSSDPKDRGSRQFGKEYDIVVELLSLGFPYLSHQTAGEQLLDSFAEAVRNEAGEGAVVLAVVENVSEKIINTTPSETKLSCLPFLSVILGRLPTSIARRVVEQSRQTLWPSSSNLGKTADFDPYSHLYGAIASTGSAAYNKFNLDDAPAIATFFVALRSSIQQCPVSLLPVYLRKSQETIRLWVEDSRKILESKAAWVKPVYISVLRFWQEVCAAFHKLPRNNPQILQHFEALIIGGFVSRRRAIVDLSVASWNTTFGREKKLIYPPRLEQALLRLSATVELSLPGLDTRVGNNDVAPSFYESESDTEVPEPRRRTPRVKETPFKITKSSRQSRSKSRSPMVPSSNSKRTSIGRTPKGRLRHEDSQLQFEAIVSSPSSRNNQDSQVLTERQREVLDRQMSSSNLYADMRSTSPLPEPITLARSPLEFHSDAFDAEYPPAEPARTPLRNVRALGPMDVFVGSSPTPQARPRSQELESDRTSVATPTAVRTVQRSHEAGDPGSSPPRFEKDTQSGNDRLLVNNSSGKFKQDQKEDERYDEHAMSFNDSITIDEDALLTGTPDEDPDAQRVTKDRTTAISISSLDVQLTAQLDAEIQAQEGAVTVKGPRACSNNTEQHPVESSADDENEADKTMVNLSTVAGVQSNAETTSTSRVDESFGSQVVETDSPQTRGLRRSHRNSTIASPQSTNSKKRKSSSGRGPGRPKKIKSGQSPDGVVSAMSTAQSNPERKLASPSPVSASDTVVVPDTVPTRRVRRSASSLSQVENHSDDVVVEDTPAPKRARRSIDRDVSEAKHGGPAVGEQSAVAAQQSNATPAASPERDSQSQATSNGVATPRRPRSIAERVFLTPRSIIDKLKEFKDAFWGSPQLTLNRQEEREADDLMFEIRKAVHAAGSRGGAANE